ncbi:MAG: branched-chain amino acid ABC transporter permease [Anaerolineales bacterium]|nr:MAG: branched-chain amino acid ABC transporter permease [Anaerolineales bacterium]
MNIWRKPGFWLPLVLVLLVGLWPIITGSAANRELVFTMLLSAALASSLNILLGYTGYVSFGHIVFFGFGAYAGFYLISVQGLPLYVGMLAGAIVPGIIAFILGKAILRLRGAYFALATIGVNEAASAFVKNFDPLGGSVGMRIPFQIYNDYGGAAQALWLTYGLMLALTLTVITVSYIVKSSKFGLGLRAIRENEDAAEVMGVVAPDAKNWAYVISAIFPGIVGVLFFFKNGTIQPGDAFRLHLSIETIVMVMLGGAGTVLGPVLGAAGYQRLRGTLLVTPIFRDIQLVVAGVMLLAIILFIPAGVVGWLRDRVPGLRKVLE